MSFSLVLMSPAFKIHPQFAVESPSGLLKAEIVIQFRIRQIPALKGDVESAVLQAV